MDVASLIYIFVEPPARSPCGKNLTLRKIRKAPAAGFDRQRVHQF
jgi:hypothetical protein